MCGTGGPPLKPGDGVAHSTTHGESFIFAGNKTLSGGEVQTAGNQTLSDVGGKLEEGAQLARWDAVGAADVVEGGHQAGNVEEGKETADGKTDATTGGEVETIRSGVKVNRRPPGELEHHFEHRAVAKWQCLP